MKRIIATILLISFFVGCKKNNQETDDIVDLRDVESLQVIKQTILGNWKIHYAIGGWTGHDRVELTDSWFTYFPNDSMYLKFNGNDYAATRPDLVRIQTVFGSLAWVLDYEFINSWQLREQLVIEMMKGDTLVLVHNYPDPYAFLMTKY